MSGCTSYKFEESLNDINSNKDIVIAGKITAAINQEQQNELFNNSKALLNSEVGEKEAVELMLSKSCFPKVLVFNPFYLNIVGVDQLLLKREGFLIQCFRLNEW